MQIISKNKDEIRHSRRANSVDTILYTRRISRHIEEEYIREFKIRKFRIQDKKRIFSRLEKRVWRRR